MGRTTRQSRDRIQAEIEQRRGQVAILLRGADKVREIAAKLNVAPSTISEDIKALRSEWVVRRKKADQEFDLDLERLDDLLRGIYLTAKQGNLSALDRALAILDRRARMFQYDQQPRPVKSEIDMTVDDRRETEELTDDQLTKIARKALQGRKPRKTTSAARKKKAGGKSAKLP